DVHKYFPQGGRVFLPKGDQDWSAWYDRGSWHTQILPFMEQDNLYKAIPGWEFFNSNNLADPFNDPVLAIGNISAPPADPVRSGGQNVDRSQCTKPQATPFRLPYGRCPSDGEFTDFPATNYVGSMGPGCVASPCGYAPYLQYCFGDNGTNQNIWGWVG